MRYIRDILTKFSVNKHSVIVHSIHILIWASMVVVWYFLLSLFVDMPAEYKLRHSTDKLRSEYTAMSERYNELTEVLENVQRRDENVFRKLFESNPYDLTIDSDDERIALNESLMEMDNDELLSTLNDRVQSAIKENDVLTQSYKDMMYAYETTSLSIDCIPSIQPVNNRQLTLLAAGKKPLINPFHRTMREHHGVDYLIPEGTPVFATADGVVQSLSEKNSSHGKAITIDHGNGYQTSYSHLMDTRVKKGAKVKRGDIIAISGNSGLSFAPHLHYEVIFNGMRVDPVHYFFMELTAEEYQRIIRIALSSMQSFD
ncbi:MAG: M23 family metallopeptidase [Alistipes sp.]|nr:M23 family metallopeptidase [Alistipes sp.]